MEGTQNKKYTNDDLREMLEDLFNSRIIDSTQKEKFIDSLYKFHRKKLEEFSFTTAKSEKFSFTTILRGW